MDLDADKLEAADKQLEQFLRRREKDLAKDGGEREFENELERRERARAAARREANRQAKIANLGHLHNVYLGEAARVADERSRLILEGGYEPNGTPGPEAA